MIDPFRHLHMPRELACEFMAAFSRMEYALKATPGYARDAGTGVEAAWDGFANDINDAFIGIAAKDLADALKYLFDHPPRKQVLQDGVVTFQDRKSRLQAAKSSTGADPGQTDQKQPLSWWQALSGGRVGAGAKSAPSNACVNRIEALCCPASGRSCPLRTLNDASSNLRFVNKPFRRRAQTEPPLMAVGLSA
jgi:hypothetical protein